MKKAISITLGDEEIVELIQIMLDDDADSALTFLKRHFKGRARELLEGG